jgi:hypothetical protein
MASYSQACMVGDGGCEVQARQSTCRDIKVPQTCGSFPASGPPRSADSQEQGKSHVRLRVKEEVAAVCSWKMTGGDVGLGPERLNMLFTGVLLGGVLGQIAQGTKELIISNLIG